MLQITAMKFKSQTLSVTEFLSVPQGKCTQVQDSFISDHPPNVIEVATTVKRAENEESQAEKDSKQTGTSSMF